MLTVVGCQASYLLQRVGVEGGGLAPSVRWAAAPSWCPVPGGSDLMLPAGAWLNNEVRSHQDQRQEAKVKSEGKKEHHHGHHPQVRALAEDKRKKVKKYTVAEITTVLE